MVVLYLRQRVALDPYVPDVRKCRKASNLGTLIDVIKAEVYPLKRHEAFETTDRLETVTGEVQVEDLSELGVDSQYGIDHIVREIERNKVMKDREAVGHRDKEIRR